MRKSKDWVTQEQMNNLITCVDNLTTSVSFIITAMQAGNAVSVQQEKEIANMQEELRTLRAELNLRGGA